MRLTATTTGRMGEKEHNYCFPIDIMVISKPDVNSAIRGED
jgi:hypothetical protein